MNIQNKKTIYYWSPCLNPVGTVTSTINSAISMKRYSKNFYNVFLINACGEWTQYENILKKNSINIINLNFNFFKFLPKKGYFNSRLSYIIIFFLSLIPLLRILKKEQPDFIICHLITSLPLSLLNFFNFNTKFILRISGYPKLNFLRRIFWKKVSKKLDSITCPTNELKNELINLKLFEEKKIFFLQDAIINFDIQKPNNKFELNLKHIKDKKIILAAGRLTKQKNFLYLIKEYKKFFKYNSQYVLLILGDGEEKENLEKYILKEDLKNQVFLNGHSSNVYNFMKVSEVFVLSSLWEEVGFVIVEAGLCNLYIISSDCRNGPTEFLNYGKNGLLFNSNKANALFESFQKYTKLSEDKKNLDKIKLKKNARQYSIFRHFIQFQKIIEKN